MPNLTQYGDGKKLFTIIYKSHVVTLIANSEAKAIGQMCRLFDTAIYAIEIYSVTELGPSWIESPKVVSVVRGSLIEVQDNLRRSTVDVQGQSA